MSGRRPRACRTRSAEAVFSAPPWEKCAVLRPFSSVNWRSCVPVYTLHALLAEVRFNRPRQILVASGENVIAALDERHLRANALKELG